MALTVEFTAISYLQSSVCMFANKFSFLGEDFHETTAVNMNSSDPDLDAKVKKTSEKISENMHIVANDPSLAFYRIQEHVRKVMPMIVERRAEVEILQQDLQGRAYDMEYAIGAIKTIQKSETSFKNTHELLKNAIFLKQQLKYEDTRRRPNASSNQNASSVYKRLSAHIQTTLDLPDLDLSGVVRETTTRMENMMSHARSAAANVSPNASLTRASSGNSSASANSDSLQRSHTTLH